MTQNGVHFGAHLRLGRPEGDPKWDQKVCQFQNGLTSQILRKRPVGALEQGVFVTLLIFRGTKK